MAHSNILYNLKIKEARKADNGMVHPSHDPRNNGDQAMPTIYAAKFKSIKEGGGGRKTGRIKEREGVVKQRKLLQRLNQQRSQEVRTQSKAKMQSIKAPLWRCQYRR